MCVAVYYIWISAPSNDRSSPANRISAPAILSARQPLQQPAAAHRSPGGQENVVRFHRRGPYEDPSTPQQTPSRPGRWAHSVDEPDKYPRLSLCSQKPCQQPVLRRPGQRKSFQDTCLQNPYLFQSRTTRTRESEHLHQFQPW